MICFCFFFTFLLVEFEFCKTRVRARTHNSIKAENGQKDSSRFFTINRARVTSGTRKAFRIIPDGVAQYPDERIGASRWRMSIEKPKRSLGCSFARLGPRSRMALETHPRDFGTKSSVRNSRSLPLIQRPSTPLRAPSSFLVRSNEAAGMHIVFSHERRRRQPGRKLSRENIDRKISKLRFKVSRDQFLVAA